MFYLEITTIFKTLVYFFNNLCYGRDKGKYITKTGTVAMYDWVCGKCLVECNFCGDKNLKGNLEYCNNCAGYYHTGKCSFGDDDLEDNYRKSLDEEQQCRNCWEKNIKEHGKN